MGKKFLLLTIALVASMIGFSSQAKDRPGGPVPVTCRPALVTCDPNGTFQSCGEEAGIQPTDVMVVQVSSPAATVNSATCTYNRANNTYLCLNSGGNVANRAETNTFSGAGATSVCGTPANPVLMAGLKCS